MLADGDSGGVVSHWLFDEFPDCWVSPSAIVTDELVFIGFCAISDEELDDLSFFVWLELSFFGDVWFFESFDKFVPSFGDDDDGLTFVDNVDTDVVLVIVVVVDVTFCAEFDEETFAVASEFIEEVRRIGFNSFGISKPSGVAKRSSSFFRSFVWRSRAVACWLMAALIRFSANEVSCNSRIQVSHCSIISSKSEKWKQVFHKTSNRFVFFCEITPFQKEMSTNYFSETDRRISQLFEHRPSNCCLTNVCVILHWLRCSWCCSTCSLISRFVEIWLRHKDQRLNRNENLKFSKNSTFDRKQNQAIR